MVVTDPPVRAQGAAARRSVWVLVAVATLIVGGSALRLVLVDTPLLEFHASRQYMSVVLASRYDLASQGQGDSERAQLLLQTRSETEPPFMEVATVLAWRVLGDEPIWVPRAITIAAWAGGAVLLFRLLRRLAMPDVGIVTAVGLWMFQPFVVQATRVFQPDPLMTVAIVLAAWAIVVDDERGSTRSLVLAGGAAGLAGLVKAPALFYLLPVFVGLTIAHNRPGDTGSGASLGRRIRRLTTRRSVAFAALAIAPALLFNAFGLFVADFLAGKEENFVFLELLVDPWFWRSWLSMLSTTIGVVAVGAMVAGLVVGRGRARVVAASLLVGYAAYGLLFTWNYATHNYYQLPLIIPVAIGVGLLASRVWERLAGRDGLDRSQTVMRAAGLVALIACITIASHAPLVPETVTEADFDREVTAPQEVGAIIGPTDRAIFMTRTYEYGLAYYGGVSGVGWPPPGSQDLEDLKGEPEMSAQERLDELREEIDAEYFVVTDIDQLGGEPELGALLDQQPVLAQGPGWIIYDLR